MVRLDPRLCREPLLRARRPPAGVPAHLASRPGLWRNAEPLSSGRAHALLSFERPAAGVPGGGAPRRTLKTAQLGNSNGYHRSGPGPIKMTVKISRAYGGCLGTKSRGRWL